MLFNDRISYKLEDINMLSGKDSTLITAKLIQQMLLRRKKETSLMLEFREMGNWPTY